MGWIVLSQNPLDKTEVDVSRHSGPFIDWLEERFPEGFPGPAVASYNTKRFETDDFDREVGDNFVCLAIAPQGAEFGVLILKALLGAALSYAISFAINALFGSKSKPDSPKEPSTVYSLATPRNSTRLGSPIPVGYGRNLFVPDHAVAPYRYNKIEGGTGGYYGNQYVCLILCLGMGEYEIHDVIIGETRVSKLPAGVVEWQQFGPTDHNQTFGAIAAATGIKENVFTSDEVTDQELRFATTYNIGPFAASPPCTRTEKVSVDLDLPQGGYRRTDKGGAQYIIAYVYIKVEQIDDNGDLVAGGNVYTELWSELFWDATPFRRTHEIAVASGRYQVSMYRAWDPLEDYSKLNQHACTVYWTGLKSELIDLCGTGSVYNETTLVSIKMKATEGLSSNAADRVKIRATRKLDGVATRSPTAALKDILTEDNYGAGRPIEELDTASLTQADSEVSGCTFDAIFDTQVSVFEGMKLAVQMIRGMPVWDGTVLSLVRDKPQNVPVAAFSGDKVRNLTRSFLFREPNDYDGLTGSFVDAIDGADRSVTWPPGAGKTENMKLWGCTSLARATCFLKQLWAQRRFRRQLVTFDLELDGAVIKFGDPINLTHRLLGPDPVLHIVTKITPQSGMSYKIETFRYQPEVYT